MINLETDSVPTDAHLVVKDPSSYTKQSIDLLRKAHFNSFKEGLKSAERLRLAGNRYGKRISEREYRSLINFNKTELMKKLTALARMERRAIEVGDIPKY
jgi:hypothetical protein